MECCVGSYVIHLIKIGVIKNEDGGRPEIDGEELREDGWQELREDGGIELREN